MSTDWTSAQEFADIANALMMQGHSVSELSRSIGMAAPVSFFNILKNRQQKVRTCYVRRLREIAMASTLDGEPKDPMDHLRQIMTKHILSRRFDK